MTDKTAAVPYAAAAVPVGTTPVISAMITTVIVPVVTAAVIATRNVGTTVPTVIVVAKHAHVPVGGGEGRCCCVSVV